MPIGAEIEQHTVAVADHARNSAGHQGEAAGVLHRLIRGNNCKAIVRPQPAMRTPRAFLERQHLRQAGAIVGRAGNPCQAMLQQFPLHPASASIKLAQHAALAILHRAGEFEREGLAGNQLGQRVFRLRCQRAAIGHIDIDQSQDAAIAERQRLAIDDARNRDRAAIVECRISRRRRDQDRRRHQQQRQPRPLHR